MSEKRVTQTGALLRSGLDAIERDKPQFNAVFVWNKSGQKLGIAWHSDDEKWTISTNLKNAVATDKAPGGLEFTLEVSR